MLLSITFLVVWASEFAAATWIVAGSSYSQYVNWEFAKNQLIEASIVALIVTVPFSIFALQFSRAGLLQYGVAATIAIAVFLVAAYFYIALVGV